MSELKPLVLLPLPEGHVLRKDVDWVYSYGGLFPVRASAGMFVHKLHIGYTTYEHWPEGVECPWVVRMNEEPVRGGSEWPAACGVSAESFRVEVGKRYVRRDGGVTGVIQANEHYQFPYTDGQLSWTSNGKHLMSGTESTMDLVAEYIEPAKPTDTRQGPDEPGEGWRFLAPEEMPIEGDECWVVHGWEPSGNWEPNHNWTHGEAQASRQKYRRRVDESTIDADGQPSVEPTVPTDPGEGFHWLEPHETLKDGDQYFGIDTRQWVDTSNVNMLVGSLGNKYRRRDIPPNPPVDIPVFNPETFTSDFGPYRQDPPMGPVERSAVIGYRTLKAQCERQAAAIERLEKAYDSSRDTIVDQAETIRELELLTADRKYSVSVKDHVHYVIDFNQPSQSELQTEIVRLTLACQSKVEAAELLAAEYKVRCEQLQDRNTELRTRNERQTTMVREEFARSSELGKSVGVIRWERRKPTSEECETRWIADSDAEIYPPGANAPEEYDDTDEICILPDILPAIEPPKTVTERLWFTKSVRTISYWTETWCVDGTVPPDEVKNRTDTVRERVVE